MLKRGNIVIVEIFLLISFSFASSFIMDSSFVGAADGVAGEIGRGLEIDNAKKPPIINTPAASLSGAKISQETIRATRTFSFSSPTTFKSTLNGVPRDITLSGYQEIEKISGQKELIGITESGTKVSGLTQAQINEVRNSGIGVEETTGSSASGGGLLSGIGTIFKGQAFGGGLLGSLVAGLAWGGIVAAGVKVLGGFFGFDDRLTNSLALASLGGAVSGGAVTGLVGNGKFLGLSGKSLGVITGIGVAAAIFIFTYKKESKKVVTFQCLPWEAPTGGNKCEECNKDPFRPCTEYRCKSLGQACEIVNGGTVEEKCVWVNPKDVTSPTIQPSESALSPDNLRYAPDNAIRPPNRGVKIIRSGASDGCLQAYTPLEFGITTNEPAQCKVDYSRNATFEEMQFFFGDTNYFLQNHTQRMKLPGPDTSEAGAVPVLENDGAFSLFVRCQDANGNFNEDAFVFNFCVDESPDTTPPIIESTSIETNSPVQFNADRVPIEVYVNEPADCKWSRIDKDYDDMENEMTCNSETYQINSDLTYTCSSELTGIQNQIDNKFYFRCRDLPDKRDNERNTNTASVELILRGSQSLNILSFAPNGTIFGTTDVITVNLEARTDDGANEGRAFCYFSPTGETDSFIAMFETDSFEHKQPLDLTPGSYEYHLRCIDAGGNAAESVTGFTVFVDRQAPRVTRVYRDESEDALKVITSEDAICAYSLQSCNFVFDEGIRMLKTTGDRMHFAEWKTTQSYYIKCRDEFENEPSPNACSVIVSASSL